MMEEVSKPITHRELVSNLRKPGIEISQDLNESPDQKFLLIMQAIECLQASIRLDMVKKQVIYNKDSGIRPNLDNPDYSDLPNISPEMADLLHMIIGVVGEAGELLEAALDHIIEDKPLDIENIREELGDLEFYQEGVRQNLSITRDETISQNISKLSVRYSSGSYSDNQAQSRADKH